MEMHIWLWLSSLEALQTVISTQRVAPLPKKELLPRCSVLFYTDDVLCTAGLRAARTSELRAASPVLVPDSGQSPVLGVFRRHLWLGCYGNLSLAPPALQPHTHCYSRSRDKRAKDASQRSYSQEDRRQIPSLTCSEKSRIYLS